MKLRPRELIETIGIFSVVASLLFVGLQLMQDRRVAIGAQFHERSLLGHEALQGLFDNNDWVKAQAQQWESGFKPSWWNTEIDMIQKDRNLSMEDMVRSILRTEMEIIRANNNYFQYQQGIITEESWRQILTGITSAMERPVYRAIALSRTIHEEGFLEVLQELEKEVSPISRIVI